jgi:cation diffusion facilitator CzcD-associated flavoprotein CzcO
VTEDRAGDGPAGDTPHLDVLVIGAGLSGVGAGHYIQTKCPWASYAIFEAREAIGGTWDLFRYPGVRSDSDMHTLGYSFRPWDGEKSIADGDSILQYIKDTAAESGVDAHIRFNHKVVRTEWSSADGVWRVTAERTDTGERFELTTGFVFSCSGYYRYDQGYQPEFAGLDDFAGQVVHPQFWPELLNFAGTRVVVIGSGATAITLVPAMASAAAHVTMLQRSPTYMGAVPVQSPAARLLRKVLPPKQAGTATKWFHALLTQGFYRVCRRFPNQIRRVMLRMIEKQLPEGYDVKTHFTPSYKPWDQRMCAVTEGDLFKALSDGSASIVTDTIDRFTENGILLDSGQELQADIVVTATGLEVLFMGGVELMVDGEKIDPASRMAYKGMMLEDIPNLAFAIGYTNASWTLKCDLTCDYVSRLLNYMHAEGLTSCTPHNLGVASDPAGLMGLSSGYIQRASHLLPQQGARYPWRVHMSYLRDYLALKRTSVVDGTMVFSGPSPDRAREAVALAS